MIMIIRFPFLSACLMILNLTFRDAVFPVKLLNEPNHFPCPPCSNDSKSLHRFLLMSGFYRKLSFNYSNVIFPLLEYIQLIHNTNK